jgi:hypothetical protein
MKDEDLRTALLDEGFREELLRRDYRTALTDEALLRGIQTREFARQMSAAAMEKKLDESALMKNVTNADLKAVYLNQAFMRGLRTNASLVRLFARPNLAAALARPAFQAELKSGRIEQALTRTDLASRLAAADVRVNAGARVTSDARKK